MPETWNDLIEDSLIEIGVLAEGESPEPQQLSRSVRRLQKMLDQWAFEGLLIPALTHYTHTVGSPAKQIFTISADSSLDPDIEGDPPVNINTLAYLHQGHVEPRPLIETNHLLWAQSQTSVASYPSHYYYEKSDPIARIYFDEITIPGDFFRVSGRTYLTAANIDGTDEHGLPRGYARAVLLNLAVEVAPMFGVKGGQGLSRVTISEAGKSKNNLRTRNIGPQVLRLDAAVTSRTRHGLRSSSYGDCW